MQRRLRHGPGRDNWLSQKQGPERGIRRRQAVKLSRYGSKFRNSVIEEAAGLSQALSATPHSLQRMEAQKGCRKRYFFGHSRPILGKREAEGVV